MSIRECLVDRVKERAMFEIQPLLPSTRGCTRSVWAEKIVYQQLSPDTANERFAAEAGRMRRKLESISLGNALIVGNRRDKACDIKRLDPAIDEVWEIRERDQPGIRLFFRFIECDCIATTNARFVSDLFSMIWLRKGLEFFPVWRAEIRRCKAVWRLLFHPYPAHSGEHLHDYLTNATGSGSF